MVQSRNLIARRMIPALGALVCLWGCEYVSEAIKKSGESGSGSGSGSSSQATEAAALRTQDGWTLRPNPVVKAGDLKSRGVWNDPSVLRDGDGYVMYLTSSTGEPFKPPVVPFRAVSRDGVSWTLDPTGPLLSPKGTPFVSLETPTVVRYKDMYHMYFTGIMPEGKIPTMAIGHATSPDGVNWTLSNGGKPVIKATGNVPDWNGFLVAEPGAVVHDGKIYLYFTAMGGRKGGNPPQVQVIALATTSDGTTFDAPRAVLEQAPLYPPEQGYVGYSTPSAVSHDGRVHLFYDVAQYNARANPQWAQVALHHAVSSDGRSFVEDALPIVTREQLGFPKGEVSGPCAVIEDGTVTMWFLGHAGAEGFIGEFLGSGKTEKFGIRKATIDSARLGQQN